jgi:N-acetylglutamate synthase-like GNAT family acetyltransferase
MEASLIEIKPYEATHKDQLIQLILNIQNGEFSVPVTLKDQPDLEQIPSFYIQGNGNFWVATDDDMVIGTIALIDIGNQQCALRKMFVKKEYRGKEKNIGKKLLDSLLTWSKSKMINEIYLGTIDSFHAAHKFYEKHGFVQVKQNELPISFPRMTFDNKFYCYKLS